MSKQNNEAKELAAKIAQLRIDIAPQSESEITVMRFKGDLGKTFPLTWSTEDSGNKDQGILTVATLKLGRRELKGYGFDRPDSIQQLEKELLGIGVTVKSKGFAQFNRTQRFLVEDSKPPYRWGLQELEEEGFSANVIEAINCVTKRPDEPYEAFVDRVLPNPIACQVKIADLLDNMNLVRLGREITEKDVARIRKYQRALARLTKQSHLLSEVA